MVCEIRQVLEEALSVGEAIRHILKERAAEQPLPSGSTGDAAAEGRFGNGQGARRLVLKVPKGVVLPPAGGGGVR